MKRRQTIFAVMTLTACLALGGCSLPGGSVAPASTITYPEPPEEAENMILGETVSSRSTPVRLSYATADGMSYTTVIHNIRVASDSSLMEAAVQELFGTALPNERIYAFPADMRLLRVSYSGGIVSVDLSLEAYSAPGDMDLLSLETCIGNTLLSLPGVSGVQVLIGDRSASVNGMPTGLQCAPVTSLTAANAQYEAEQEHFLSGDGISITRSVALYYPSRDGEWYIPQLAEITFDSDNYAEIMIEALSSAAIENSCCRRIFSGDKSPLDGTPTISIHSNGERMLDINLSKDVPDYLEQANIEPMQMAGAITLTLCSFIPELDAVRFTIGHDPIGSDDLFRRDDFADRVGSIATIHLVDTQTEGGGLIPVECAVSQRTARSPRLLLQRMFEYANTNAEGAGLPTGYIEPEDLLGIQVQDGTARINLSGAFYHAAQTLNPDQERLLVYAIVNTLCELDDIEKVRFYIEGIAAETLSGSIYLKSPLMANPGLVGGATEEETENETDDIRQ